jgi:LuxR family maltose regulon positive regulatory protein
VVRGHLRQAADMFRQVLDWGSGRMRPLYAVAQAHIGLGDVLREWNRLEEAEHYLTEGVRQCERGEYTRYAVFGYVALARLRRRQGRREAVFENLEKAEQFARRAGIRKDMAFVAAHRARLCLTPEVNDMAAALAWAEQAGWNAPEQTDTNREVECFTLFRLHIVQTQRGEIPPAELEADLDTLAALLRAAESSDRTASILESLALQALMLHVLGRQVNAIKSLERALAIAEAQDYASVFVDEGKMMARLLIQVTNPLISTAYIGRLMAILQEKEVSGSPDRRALVAGLTEREYEVLRLIAAGLSNREISDRLVVTLTTVKAHARNIYSKLDVNSRSQAAALARKMNLI